MKTRWRLFKTQNLILILAMFIVLCCPGFSLAASANDDDTYAIYEEGALTVSAPSFAPHFTSTPYEDALIDQMYRYRISAADDNPGDTVTITGSVVPEWLTFIDGGDGRAYLSGTPTAAEVGDHFVELIATDSSASALSSNQAFTITVHDTNISKENWSVTCDTEEVVSADQGCVNVIDGDLNTFWQSQWLRNNPDAVFPHWIEIDLGNVYEVNGFIYTPRADKANGRIENYEFYVSSDGTDGSWGDPVATGTFANTATPKEVIFEMTSGQHVKLVGLDEVRGGALASAVEIDILGGYYVEQEENEAPDGFIDIPFDNTTSIQIAESVNFAGRSVDSDGDLVLYQWNFSDPAAEPVDPGITFVEAAAMEIPGAIQFNSAGTHTVTLTVSDGLQEADPTPVTRTIIVVSDTGDLFRDLWNVSCDSEELNSVNRPCSNAIDGDPDSFWHTEWIGNNPEAVYPHWIDIDLGGQYLIDGFRYLPRQDYYVGRIGSWEFYVSDDGMNWGAPVATGAFNHGPTPSAAAEQTINFSSVSGQFVRLKGLNSIIEHQVAAIAELNIIGKDDLNGNQRPNSIIDIPVDATITVDVGVSVGFAGSGTDPDNPAEVFTYHWNFGGPTIPVSTSSTEMVTFNTAGTYTVQFTVTDSQGAADLSPATRTVTVISDTGELPRDNWVITVDFQETVSAQQGAFNVKDGNTATFWHTEWLCNDPNAILPHWIEVDMGDHYELDAFSYLPRQDKSNGRIKDYIFYVSWDGLSWTPVSNGQFVDSPVEQTKTFSKTPCRYVRLEALTEVNGNQWTSMAEFYLFGKTYSGPAPNQAPNGAIDEPSADQVIVIGDSIQFSGSGDDPEGDPIFYHWNFDNGTNPPDIADSTEQDPLVQFDEAGTYIVRLTVSDGDDADPTPATRTITVTYNSIPIPNDTWSIHDVSSEETISADQAAEKAIDGATNTFWQSEWLVHNPNAVYPHDIQIDLGIRIDIDSVVYLPRQDTSNGRIKDYELCVSIDGVNWGSPVATGVFQDIPDAQEIFIPRTRGQYIKLAALTPIIDGYNLASVADLYVYGDYIQSSMLITPSEATVQAGDSIDFDASNGIPPYTFSWLDNQSNGSITPDGSYTAGLDTGVIDTVRVTDSTYAVKDAIVNVVASLAITPNFRYVAVNGKIDFNVSGGVPPYTFDFVTNASGGTLDEVTGLYQAGTTFSVNDVVSVTDFVGTSVEATASVLDMPLAISPTAPSVAAVTFLQFESTGGVPPYAFMMTDDPSGGTITGNGLYTAGNLIGAVDRVRVTDSDSAFVETNVTVTGPYQNIPKTGWTIHSVDSEELVAVQKPAEFAIDDDITTVWHTEWHEADPPPPHEIAINFGDVYEIDGLVYTPRQKNPNGRINMYEIYVSMDGVYWGQPVASGFFSCDGIDPQPVIFQREVGQYVKLRAISEINSRPWTAVAEIDVPGVPYSGTYLPPDSVIDLPSENLAIEAGDSIFFMGYGEYADGPEPLSHHWTFDFAKSGIPDFYSAVAGSIIFNQAGIYTVTYTVTDGANNSDPTPDTRVVKVLDGPSAVIPNNSWVLDYVDSEELNQTFKPAVNAFDGDPNTFWHTEWLSSNPDAVCPHEIIVNLGSSYLLDTLSYLPRQDGSSVGRVADYHIFVSENGREWGPSISSGTFVNSTSEKSALFASKRGQFVRFVAMSEAYGRDLASMAEMNLDGVCNEPYVKIIDPEEDSLVQMPDLTVTASVCLNSTQHAGWGVRFLLNNNVEEIVTLPSTGMIEADTFKVTFPDIDGTTAKVEAFIVNDLGVDVAGANTCGLVDDITMGQYYVAMGDSLTFGYFDDESADDVSLDGRNSGGGFTPVLNNLLTADTGLEHTVINSGLCGEKTGEGLKRLPKILRLHPHAGHVLLLYGANDILDTLPGGLGAQPGDAGYPDTYKAYMRAMVDLINDAGKKAYIAKEVYRNYPAHTVYNQVMDEIIDELNSDHDPSNDISVMPPAFDLYFQHHPEQIVDKTHPNGAGYAAMGELWKNSLLDINNIPVAENDTGLSCPENSDCVIDVLANDYDLDRDSLEITAANGAAHGTLSIDEAGVVVYSPVIGYAGSDSFTYDISDGQGGMDTAEVTVTVIVP